MRPTFADLRNDFVFKRVFGREEHKDLLISLLNALLDLGGDRAIVDLTYLREEERPVVEELKHSIVDVKCRDARGVQFVVEMQVLEVEGFEKRVVYNASKAYANQLARGDSYPRLNDVIAVTVCDFVLWPDAPGAPRVPLVSHWRMQERHSGREGLPQVQYVFVELPKLPSDRAPADLHEEWAFVFRNAWQQTAIPAEVVHDGPRRAMEAARSARFTAEEWERYDRALVALQDARGALSLVERRGRAEGFAEGALAERRALLRRLWTADDPRRSELEAASGETLERWLDEALRTR